jgi:hypothetical protein
MALLAATALGGWVAAFGGPELAPGPARAAGSPPARGRHVRLVHWSGTHVKRAIPPLTFGIYPGGAVGTVGTVGAAKPEDPARRLRALQALRPAGRPFMLRLYAQYYGPRGATAAQQAGRDAAGYMAAGFEVELVLAYRPRSGGGPSSVAGFDRFVRDTVRSLGGNPRFVSLQITNEVNVGGAPNVADGYYRGAKDALIGGVLAAKREISGDGFAQLRVGFNWAYVTDRSEASFWNYLASHGGRRFRAALDWVGLDVYPGTWGPPLGGGSLGANTTRFVDKSLDRLRSDLRVAGIRATVPLHVSEYGYPTGPSRSEAMQADSMRGSIAAVTAARRFDDITSVTWFDLRDADSSSSSFQSQYGILHDDYSPKPAFAVYRSLIARLSRLS